MYSEKFIKKVFNEYDINDEGFLDSEHLCKALVSLKIPVELSDMPDVLESVGRQKEGTVGLNDFVDIVMEFKDSNDYADNEEEEEGIQDSLMETAFRMLADPSLNGITLERLLEVCKAQEESWTQQQVIEMMNDADLNHDGIIDSNEFKIIYKKVGL